MSKMRTISSSNLTFREVKKKRKINTSAFGRAIIFIIQAIIAVLIAGVLVYCLGTQVDVNDTSMDPEIKAGSTILVDRLSYNIQLPKVGDIIVFKPNGNEDSNYYIKRIVATPGDRVRIEDGALYVNGKVSEYVIGNIESAGVAADDLTMGEDEYFVVGDNINDSEDSRFANIGNVRAEYILGKAWLLLKPTDNIKRF